MPLQAAVLTVGSDQTCDYQDLQIAINDSLSNIETANELRLVNDGSYNHKSYLVDYVHYQDLTIVGGFDNCEDANNNIITDKTIIDAQDTEVTESIFTITSPALLEPFKYYKLILQNLILKNSQASQGGAISVNNTNIEFRNIDMLDNTAENGGAIYCAYTRESFHFSEAVIFSDTLINNNHATNDGGAYYIADNNHNFLGCITFFEAQNRQTTFANNSAENNGGAIYIGHNSTDVIYTNSSSNEAFPATVLYRNNSANNGGAIYQSSGQLQFSHSIFQHNTAQQTGGAICSIIDNNNVNLSMNLDIWGTEFNNNQAGISGGAIYANATDANIGLSISGYGKFDNNNAPVAAIAEIVSSNLNLRTSINNHKSTITNHKDSQSLFKITNSYTTSIANSLISNNTNIDNLFDIVNSYLKIQKNEIVNNQINQNIIEKNGIFRPKSDQYYFNTITDNTIGMNVIEAKNTTFDIRNNIIWQNENTLFNFSNSTGDYDCNIVSSQSTAFNSTRNTIINPEFASPDNYYLSFSSPAIDYCNFNNNLMHQDFYDWEGIENLFGVVDLGAHSYDDLIFRSNFR